MLSGTTSPLKKVEPAQHLPSSMQKLISQMQTNTKRSRKMTSVLPVKRLNMEKNNGRDFAGLARKYPESNDTKLDIKPPTVKRALLSKNETIDFPGNEDASTQYSQLHENDQLQMEDLTDRPGTVASHLQHQMTQFVNTNFDRGDGENLERYAAAGKSFTYPSVHEANNQNNYCTNSEFAAARSEKISAPDVANDNNRLNGTDAFGYRTEGMRSSMKTSSSSRKKWVTFNDIIQSETEKTSFVDELYDEDEQDGLQERTNSAVCGDGKSTNAISENAPLTLSNRPIKAVEQASGSLEKLSRLIQQVREVNDMITKARGEILKFCNNRSK